MKSKCPDIEKYLSILRQMIDGETSKEEEASLMEHIEQCTFCLNEYEIEQQIRNLLKSKKQLLKLPEDLEQSIRKKIYQFRSNVS